MSETATDNRSLLQAVAGDGRFLLVFTGLILILAGMFVIVQSLTGHFLPHDVAYLGLDAAQLSAYNNGTITRFMFHDRVSFGGSIIAVGMIYMWLAEFPLRRGERWAWYILVFSGIVGFGSFLTYLGYGYLDTWHGVATALLLPFFIAGIWRSRKLIKKDEGFRQIFRAREGINLSPYGAGKFLMLFSAGGIFFAGVTIMIVGMTTIFVPQDLAYMNITVCGIQEINSNLKPLIAHDRAAFGGGLATIGLLYFFIIRCSGPSVNLWQIVCFSMFAGFSTAIGVHFVIGYTDFIHLLPAYAGVLTSAAGLALTYKKMMRTEVLVFNN
jgi:MFS family permease